MGELGSANTVVIEENLWKHVKNEEKVGGNVKIEEHVVRGSSNTQEMRRSCVMSEEVVSDNEWHSEELDSDAPIGEGDLDDTDDRWCIKFTISLWYIYDMT